MPIKFDKLFVVMKEKGLSTYRIRKENIMGQATLQSLRSNEPVSTETIAILCEILDCQPGDIMEYVKDDSSRPRAPKAEKK
ncbi:helix-turn-helix domain-containing protein [Caproiciproducens faecalis]|uniref:Helix-turn-helix transcriptional regulator n=1 Tax=Caproiciproducens faecalis TaxID=2820301 RepID=A0ABS7DPC7_9FIRM|nr:helix-turn-helix transcriptional regulator [Caproiciproducens faecalis]MBW7573163.1 helix-turn-helix transcriptional regulator [Caproiciproducens faecalis]